MRSSIGRLVCGEPYRLFFPLGILMGILGIGHWLAYRLGWIGSYSGLFHALVQVWLYMGCTILGFLATAIPRFAGAPTAKAGEILGFLAAFFAMFFLLWFRQWVAAESIYILWVFLLGRFIWSRFSQRRAPHPPLNFIWIPFAFLHGVSGASFMILSQTGVVDPEFLEMGRELMEQGFLLCVVVGVGGFLGPRLMGTFVPKEGPSRYAAAGHVLGALLLFSTFFLDAAGFKAGASVTRALLVSGALAASRALTPFPPPSERGIFGKLLWLSFLMVALGLWLVVFFPKLSTTFEHVMFLGGFSLMAFVVSTMVVLSHAGEGDRVFRPLWIFWVILFGIAGSLTVRITASFFAQAYFSLLGAAAALWVLTGVSWLIFAARYLLKTPVSAQFETRHERAKQGVC